MATNGAEYEYDSGVLDPDWNSLNSTFDKYDSKGEDPGNDKYVAHSTCDPADNTCVPVVGTGFRLFDTDGITPIDYGREIKIKTGAQDQTSAGWFQPVQLRASDNGAKDYCDNIKGCSGVTNIIGETIETENGNMVGPTDQCLWTDKDSLASQDPTAKWVPDYFGKDKNGNPVGAVVSDDYPVNQSPRIVPLPVINPDEFFATDPNGHTELTVRNILGFFIDHPEGKGGQQTDGRLPGQRPWILCRRQRGGPVRVVHHPDRPDSLGRARGISQWVSASPSSAPPTASSKSCCEGQTSA